MTRRELDLRKELALAHLRIARAELRLSAPRRPDTLSLASSALSLTAAALTDGRLGPWSQYARLAVSVARALLGVKRALAIRPPRATEGTPTTTPRSPHREHDPRARPARRRTA